MVKSVVSMGIIQYEELKLKQQEIELKALIAIAQFGRETQKYEALKHLEYMAYPEDIEL